MKKYKLLILGLLALFFASNSRADVAAEDIATGYCKISGRTDQDNVTKSACYSAVSGYFSTWYSGFFWGDYTGRIYELTGIDKGTGTEFILAEFYISTTNYSCINPEYPILNDDGLTCSADVDDFVIDNDVVAEYIENAATAIAAADTYEFCVTSDDGYSIDCVKTDDTQALLDSIESDVSEQAVDVVSQTSDLEDILTDSNTLDSALEDDPDSLSIAAAAVVVDSLADDTEDLLDESTSLSEASETLQDSATNVGVTLDTSLSDVETSYASYTDLVKQLSTSKTQDEYDATLVEMQTAGYCDGSYCGDFSNITASLDDANDDADTIASIKTTVADNKTTTNNNTTTTNNNSTTSNSVTNNVTNNYGGADTSSDDDSDDDDIADFSLENSETDYETFSDVMTGFYDSVSDSPIAQSFDSVANMITVSSGSCPNLSIDLSGTIIGQTLSTTMHCDVWDGVSSTISGVMLVCWCFLGFRIVASA